MQGEFYFCTVWTILLPAFLPGDRDRQIKVGVRAYLMRHFHIIGVPSCPCVVTVMSRLRLYEEVWLCLGYVCNRALVKSGLSL